MGVNAGDGRFADYSILVTRGVNCRWRIDVIAFDI
jgi:hypothetical protein